MSTRAGPGGPVDLDVFGFVDPEAAVALSAAVERTIRSGAVRVLDAIWIRKDPQGVVTIVDADDDSDSELLGFPTHEPGLLGEEDVADIAASIPDDSAAAVIAWENLWAADLTATIVEAGGFELSHQRIPGGALDDLLDILDE
ncbi:MAG: DUF6325 family protein [Aeromicrobium sp.]